MSLNASAVHGINRRAIHNAVNVGLGWDRCVTDYYWQDYSWARVFNDNPYDRLRGYTNVNLTLIFTSQERLAGDAVR